MSLPRFTIASARFRAGIVLLLVLTSLRREGVTIAKPQVEKPVSDRVVCGMRMERRLPEVSLSSANLSDVLEFVADVGPTVRLDEPALAAVGITAQTPVTGQMRNLRISQFLWAVARSLPAPAELTQADDGALTLTAGLTCRVGVYDVRRFLNRASREAEAKSVREFEQLVCENVDAISWKVNSGFADLWCLDGRLFVVQTPRNHAKIAKLIEDFDARGGAFVPAPEF